MNACRFKQNPIIHPEMDRSIGNNINGPSLIRIPDWIQKPLGRYYLYFADHNGTYIRLAYANALEGPWTIHQPGTLHLAQTCCIKHIASPDVHIDHDERTIRMYFHGPVSDQEQKTFLAQSKDGLHFRTSSVALGPSYFRVFKWGGYHYAITNDGATHRSSNGVSPFLSGPVLFPGLRHCAVQLKGDVLFVYYSIVGDCPERIVHSSIPLSNEWTAWKGSPGRTLLEPEFDYEGATRPLVPSIPGPAPGRVRELRDPAIYEEGDRTFLLYSAAGESGIGMAELSHAVAGFSISHGG